MLDFRDNTEAEINKRYNPPDNIRMDRRRVYERYAAMRAGRVGMDGINREEKWNGWMRRYDAWRPSRSDDDWQSNITPPFTTSVVEKALAEIVDQTLRPIVLPRGAEDRDKAKLMNYGMDYTWEIANGDLELYSSVKQALILGDTVWQEYYFRDKREVKILKKLNFESKVEEYDTEFIYDYDDVYGETVNLYDFFVDPNARDINEGRYKANDAIRRFIMNYDTFMELFKDSIWDQFGATQYVKAGGDLNYWQFYKPPEGIDKENQVEVLFYWGRRPDKFIIVANDVVVRDGPNPYNHKQLPFVKGSDIPTPNQFYSKGEPALLESIQDELTTIRRMRLDRQHMDIWKMFLVSNRETLDEDEAIISPSRFLYVDDPQNSIKPLEYRDINPSAYREEELLKQDGREVTGIEAPQPAATATEAAIFKEATQRALRLKVWLLSRQLLTGIAKLRVPNIMQYWSVPRAEQVVGEERITKFRTIRTQDVALQTKQNGQLLERREKGEHFFEVKPEMLTPIYGGFDFKIKGEPTLPISKPLLQQRLNELMQNPLILSAVEGGYYDLGKVADKLMEAHEYDPDEFKAQTEVPKRDEPIDQAKLLELANQENELLISGEGVPPTPYATQAHIDVHHAFMQSEEFVRVAGDLSILENFITHVRGEETAIQQRGQAPQGGKNTGITTPQRPQSKGILPGQAKATQPAKMLGSEGLPQGVSG